MSKQLCSLLVVALCTGTILADDEANTSPTPEQVNENPQMYVGKTLVFDHVTLRDKPRNAPKAKVFRFKISTPQKMEFLPPLTDSQRFFFGTPDKREIASTFVGSLDAGQEYPVRLTCEILKRGEKDFMASVRRLDQIRFEHPNKPEGNVEEASIEDVVKEPAKYVGKVVVFDRMKFTGNRKNRPTRFSFEVQSPLGTALSVNHSDEQSIIFATPDKSLEVKNYVKVAGSDRDRPLRIVCEFLKIGEGKYVASMKRIDLIRYNYDALPTFVGGPDPSGNSEGNSGKTDPPNELGGKIKLKNNIDLFYTKEVPVDEARRLGAYLEKWQDQGRSISIQINREGKIYQFRMRVKTGLDQDQDCIQLCKLYAKELSTNVFGGASVEIHLCDGSFKKLRVVIPLAE